MKKKPLIVIMAVIAAVVLLCAACVVISAVVINRLDDDNNSSQDSSKGDDDSDNSNDDSDSESNSNDSNACDHLTKDIAEDILKTEVKASESSSDNTCTYVTSEESLEDFGVLTMVVTDTSSDSEARRLFETAKSVTYGNNTDNVSGLDADGAYWAGSISQLSILKDDKWIIISGTSALNEDNKQMAIDTAEEVLKTY